MTPRVRKIFKNGKETWEVDYGIDPVTGKRPRRFYKTEGEALDAVGKSERDEKRLGDYWPRLPAHRRSAITATLREMDRRGVTVERVWSDWLTSDEEHQDTITPKAYSAVIDEWEKRKTGAGKSDRYITQCRQEFEKFGQGREQQPIHMIKPNDLQDYMDSRTHWGLSTKATQIALYSSLWKVAVNKGWALKNITERLEPVKKPGVDVRINTNEQVKNLLAGVMYNEITRTVMVPIVLGLFGCMRPEEIESAKARRKGLPESKLFGWRYVDLDNRTIRVEPWIAKTGDTRIIRLQPTAHAWLSYAKKNKYMMVPVNERRIIDSICEIVGFEWIRDGLRKDCATHLREVYKNDYEVVKDMGNSVRTLLKNYAALKITAAQSNEYWSFTPDKIEEYMKTQAWLEHLKSVADAAAANRERSANENATSES